ncbi:archaeal heat shock protein Hsp14 [Geoglobus sp.]
MARLLDEFDMMSLSPAGVELSMPVDVIEEEDRLRVIADLPGFEKSDIQVYIEDGDLVIRAVRKEEKEDREKNYIRKERRYGEIYRRVSLPVEVDEDRIQARYNNGVLEIEIPKTARERKIIRIE